MCVCVFLKPHSENLWLFKQTIDSKPFNLCSKSHNTLRSYTHQSIL